MSTPPEAVAAAVAETVRKRVRESGISTNALARQTGIPRITLTRRLGSTGGKGWLVDDVAAIAAAIGTTHAQIALEAEAS